MRRRLTGAPSVWSFGSYCPKDAPMFKRILIANRGEIALRVIRACRGSGIESVAVSSEADAESPHLRHADQASASGARRRAELPRWRRFAGRGAERGQGVHPGYGFLAENALFAERCAQHKLTFIGPPPRAIRLMGDKADGAAHDAGARPAGGPRLRGRDQRPAEARRSRATSASRSCLRLPPAAAARGCASAREAGALGEAFAQALGGREGLRQRRPLPREVHRARPAHRVPVPGRRLGNAVHLGERECSVQRRHQKLIEESPSGGRRGACAQMGRRQAALHGEHRLRRRRHRGVPARPRTAALLHGGEHAAPGRAPGHRAGHRPRHGQGADPGRGQPRPVAHPGRGTVTAGHASSAASTPRTPSPSSSLRRAWPRSSRRRCRPPSGGSKTSTRPGEGRKPSNGSSALMRHSIAWPRELRPRPARARAPGWPRRGSARSTRSRPVTISVTGCSTCRRVFTSMK